MLRDNPSNLNLLAVTRAFARIARIRNLRQLETYLSGDEFLQRLAGMTPSHRTSVFRALATARAECREQLIKRTPLVARGSMRVRWKDNDELIAKVRKLAPLYPNDEDLARRLGIPLDAARLGRYKYVGRKTPKTDATDTSTLGHQISP